MDTKNTQNTPADFGNASFRTRLIICALVLVVGFAMGWLNGRGTTDNSGIVSRQTAAQGTADGTQSDSGSRSQSSPDQSSGKNGGSGSSQSSNSGQSSSKGDDSSSSQSSKKDKDAQSSKKNDQSSTSSSSQAQKPEAGNSSSDSGSSTVAPERGPTVTEDGTYTSKDEVALYIHTYGHLPSNFIGKKKASDRGWIASEGNLQEVCPGMSIGGSKFYNDDGQLPDKKGRQWTECDINYHGGHRGAERIVFSNDGLIFYTGDHYKTFEQLY